MQVSLYFHEGTLIDKTTTSYKTTMLFFCIYSLFHLFFHSFIILHKDHWHYRVYVLCSLCAYVRCHYISNLQHIYEGALLPKRQCFRLDYKHYTSQFNCFLKKYTQCKTKIDKGKMFLFVFLTMITKFSFPSHFISFYTTFTDIYFRCLMDDNNIFPN